jgi:isocitrate dehydrogenase
LHFSLADASCSVMRSHYLNTEEFIDAVADELRSRLAANSNL